MQLKMNFKVDEPTVNGNIYTKEVMQNAIDEFNNMAYRFIYDRCVADRTNIGNVVATINNITINDNNEIIVDFDPSNGSKFNFNETYELTIFGYGRLNYYNGIITDYKLSYLFLTKFGGCNYDF